MSPLVRVGICLVFVTVLLASIVIWTRSDYEYRMGKNIAISIAKVKGKTGVWPKTKATLLENPNLAPLISDFDRGRPFEIRLTWSSMDSAEYELVSTETGRVMRRMRVPKELVRRHMPPSGLGSGGEDER